VQNISINSLITVPYCTGLYESIIFLARDAFARIPIRITLTPHANTVPNRVPYNTVVRYCTISWRPLYGTGTCMYLAYIVCKGELKRKASHSTIKHLSSVYFCGVFYYYCYNIMSAPDFTCRCGGGIV